MHWAPQTYELNGAAQCDAQLKQLKENRDMAVVLTHNRNLLDRKSEQETILQVGALDCAGVQLTVMWIVSGCYLTVPVLGNHRNFLLYIDMILASCYRS